MSLDVFLECDDQMVARQYIWDIGYETGCEDYERGIQDEVAETLFIMSPIDADFFAQGYFKGLEVTPESFAVLWLNPQTLPNGDDIAPLVHSYRSSTAPMKKAVILSSLAKSAGEIRSMVLFAVDSGIPLDNCHIACAWMPASVHGSLCRDLGGVFGAKAFSGATTMQDDMANGVNLARCLNLPEKGLTYLPALVTDQMQGANPFTWRR